MAANDYGPGYAQGQEMRLTFRDWDRNELGCKSDNDPVMTRNQYLAIKEAKAKAEAEAKYTRLNDGARFDRNGRQVIGPVPCNYTNSKNMVDTSAQDAIDYHADNTNNSAIPNIQKMMDVIEEELSYTHECLDFLDQKLSPFITPNPDGDVDMLVARDGVDEMCYSNTGARLRHFRSMLKSIQDRIKFFTENMDS